MSDKHQGAGKLDAYRRKRAPGATPEPFGSEALRPGLFVVQLHSARKLHYDLRLEIGGTLKSWAVPKGPSLDPGDKRLAVQTEDHPVEYGDFEGVIPQGNYGAGAMIVWDRGRWVPVEDPDHGLVRGKLLFELYGYKLRGLWTLVKTTRGDREWLLIKKPDGWARKAGEEEAPRPESVLSGMTVDELRDGRQRDEEIRAELAAAAVPAVEPRARKVGVMLAETRRRPFSDPGWLFELKYDGYRMLAERNGGRARLTYRSGREATAVFPEVARAVAALPYRHLVLDGEVVVLDPEGRPSFQLLQRRAQVRRAADLERAAVELPATLYLFDLPAFGGYDLRRLPLSRRKEILERIVPRIGPLRYSDHVAERGAELYEEIRRRGLEGMMAKRADSPYRPGRSAAWLKVPVERRGDFAVVGFTAGKGSRPGPGALHLGARDPETGELVYAGRVGTGFSMEELEGLEELLRPEVRASPPVTGPAPRGPEHTWIEPLRVAEVRYKQWTGDGLLRQPVFVRLRPDKDAGACDVRPAPVQAAAGVPVAAGGAPGGTTEAAATAGRPAEGRLELTRTEKVFWPEEGITKGDLLEYYRTVSRWMLPYLEDRPVVLDRYPDGIAGKSFFQKNAPGYVPSWVRTARVWSDEGGEEVDYFVCNGVDSLLYLVNLGAIPLHVGAARIADIEHPDWCVLDLDPKGAPFTQVVTLAKEIRRIAEELELPCFVKTSGGSGLHVLLPLGGTATHQQSRLLGELLARLIVQRHPEIATTARAIADRRGKVYVDYLQNGRGKLLVAPFSVRPFPGAPVSTPLRWREVGPRLDPARFTIATVPARLRRMRGDPLGTLLDAGCDLERSLELLAAGLQEDSSA